MRPVRLAMTAFGPYPDTEVVDFDLLADLGLFAVAGRNGSGKTTIFDGLYFALYGSLPGRRASYHRLRSDHARADVECRVVFDFIAHGEHWRVERFPKQRTRKRRGIGETERQQRAALFRIVEGQPHAVVNRIREVDTRCRELIGLSGPQFERVALLPQGEFSRLLQESGTERRSLLRALFASEVFGDATSLLVSDAAEVGREHELVEASLDERLQRITDQTTELCGEPVANDPVSIAEAIDDHEAGELRTQAARVDELRDRASEHARAVQRARDVHERIERRDRVARALDIHRQQEADIRRDLDRLVAARAAVPVVDMAQVAHRQRRAHDESVVRVDELRERLAPLLPSLISNATVPDNAEGLDELGNQIEQRVEALTAIAAAADQVSQLEQTVNALRADNERISEAERAAQRQRRTLLARRDRLDDERAQIEAGSDRDTARHRAEAALEQADRRADLHELDLRHDRVGNERQALATARARLQARIDEAETAQRQQAACNDAARAAADTLEDAHRRRRAHSAFESATTQLTQLRSDLNRAQQLHDTRFDAFIRGTSARLAETLVDGEPCSVCGATEHPAPAAATDDLVTQSQVAEARSETERLRSALNQVERDLEALQATDPDLATIDVDALDEQIEIARARALAADNAANENTRLVTSLDQLRDQQRIQREADGELVDELRQIDEHRHRTTGALGDAARQSVDELRACAAEAAEVHAEAERAHHRRHVLLDEIDALDTRVEAVELAELDLRERRATVAAELDARTDDLAQATALLDAAGDDREPRAQLERARYAYQAARRLGAAFAERASTADSLRRAELTLTEKLAPSPFHTAEAALAASCDAQTVRALEASTTAWTTQRDQLDGELRALGDVPDIRPDLDALTQTMAEGEAEWQQAHQLLTHRREICNRLRRDITELADALHRQQNAASSARRLERVAALVKGDNDHNTSLENWVLAAHLRDVVDLANLRLASSTQQRFQLCVLDDGEHRRGRWGLDLAVEDTVTGTRRPTAGLSGGELFQASLALALGLADVVMNQRAGVRIDALFIDEGFGSLDETSVERVIDLLDEVRSRGALVGVITHVSALLDALPRGITVVPRSDGSGSTIQQRDRAA